MQIVKTSELIGAQLDWAVAVAEGKHADVNKDWGNAFINDLGRCSISHRNWNGAKYFEPSKNWGHGGPIIDREKLGLMPISDASWRAGDVDGANGYGTSPLIAAMRCYVTSKLGAQVEVPDAPTPESVAAFAKSLKGCPRY